MADEKKNPIKEITDKLEKGIAELFESEKYKTYLNTMSKFHNYSFNNTLLIAMQKPDATYVAGFDSWKKNFERHVNRGEKGIKIIAPMAYKKKVEQDVMDPKTNMPVLNPDGTTKREEVEVKIPAFQAVTVFDVSQTQGKDLPQLGVSELIDTVDDYRDMIHALEKVSPVPIERADIESGAKGYFSPTEQKIVLQKDMSEAQTVKTLIHEISHSLTDDKDNQRIEIDNPENRTRGTKEVTAESVAYTVCQHFGIDTSDYSFGYIAGWSSGKDMKELKDSMDTIRKTASKLINDIELEFKELQKDRVVENVAEEPKKDAKTFEIWQLKDTPENHKIVFENMDYLKKEGISVDRDNYELVYSGALEDGMSLEGIFEKFNIERPDDFMGHSLSVSDVVVLKDGDGEKAFFVDSMGFADVPEFLHDKEINQSLSKEVSDIQKLAERIDKFTFDYDTYGYRDAVDDREANIASIAADLESGECGYLTEFFQNIIEEDNALPEDIEQAKELLSAVDAYQPNVKVEEMSAVAPIEPAKSAPAATTEKAGKQKSVEQPKAPSQSKVAPKADKSSSKSQSQTKTANKKTSLKARLEEKKEEVAKKEKKQPEKTKSKNAEREDL